MSSRTHLEQAADLVKEFPMPTAKPRDGRKPCACGNPDHVVIQREDEKTHAFHRRRYASKECCPLANDVQRGALVSPLDWLVNAPPGRITAQRQALGLIP